MINPNTKRNLLKIAVFGALIYGAYKVVNGISKKQKLETIIEEVIKPVKLITKKTKKTLKKVEGKIVGSKKPKKISKKKTSKKKKSTKKNSFPKVKRMTIDATHEGNYKLVLETKEFAYYKRFGEVLRYDQKTKDLSSSGLQAKDSYERDLKNKK